MTVTVAADGPCRRTLSFSIERSVLEAATEERVTQIAATVQFKGFRPGKVPMALVRKTYGRSAAEEARRSVMSEAFAAAVDEHEIQPVGDPELNLQVLEDDGKGPFTFELAVEIVPAFDLQLDERFAVTIVLPEVGEAMIEGEVERLREQTGGLDATFFERAGLRDEDELRERIRKELEAQRARFRNQLIDRELDKLLVDRHDFPLPERLLSKAVDRRVHELAHQAMDEQQTGAEQAHHEAEEQRAKIAELTTRGMRLAFLLNRIARDQGLLASPEAAEQQVRLLARQQEKDPEASVEHAYEQGWLGEVQEQITHNNARAWLRERTDVTEQLPSEPEAGQQASEASEDA